jgi:hypothetical protein
LLRRHKHRGIRPRRSSRSGFLRRPTAGYFLFLVFVLAA